MWRRLLKRLLSPISMIAIGLLMAVTLSSTRRSVNSRLRAYEASVWLGSVALWLYGWRRLERIGVTNRETRPGSGQVVLWMMGIPLGVLLLWALRIVHRFRWTP